MNLNLDLFLKHRVVNWHEHVWFDESGKMNRAGLDKKMEASSLIGIDMTVLSLPYFNYCTPEEMEAANNCVNDAVALYPDQLRGLAYVDPILGRYAVSEIDRCVQNFGFIGVKLYTQFYLDDPAQYPIVEKCIDLDIPILMHAGKSSDTYPSHVHLSNSVHFYNLAKRYPEAKLIMAHIGGGGDWNWQLKRMKECPSVFIDVSGSVFDSPMLEETADVFGAERMLFGTDGSYSSSVGKILSANLTIDEKRTILDNPHFSRYVR